MKIRWARVLAISSTMLIGLALCLHLTLPPLPKVTRPHHDLGNLRSIYEACSKYASDHGGKLPEDWSQLEAYGLDWRSFVVRDSTKVDLPMSEVMNWTDYVYLGAGRTLLTSNDVLAYAPVVGDWGGYGVIQFGDGSSKVVSPREMPRILKPQQEAGRYGGQAGAPPP